MSYIQNPYSFADVTYLFDDFTNALFGYSLQKLRTGQVNGVRLERSSDNAQTDVELYDSGSIDLSSTVSAGGDLSTWIGSDTGYVVTWYDQSGNGFDLTEVIANAPKLVIAGVLEIHISHSIVRFSSATADLMNRAALTELADGNDFTFFTVSVNLSTLLGTLVATSTGSNRMQLCHDRRTQKRGSFALGSSTSGFADLDAQYDNSVIWQQSSFVDGTGKDVTHWKDGVAGGANQAWTGTYTNDTLTIGGGASGNQINGRIFELVCFSDDKTGSRTTIETDQNARYA